MRYIILYLPESITAINNMIKAPEKRPTLNVIHGERCSPSGGTLSRFIARCLSPCSKSRVTKASVSAISLSISLPVWKIATSTCSARHLAPTSTFRSYKISLSHILCLLSNSVKYQVEF